VAWTVRHDDFFSTSPAGMARADVPTLPAFAPTPFPLPFPIRYMIPDRYVRKNPPTPKRIAAGK